MKKNRIGLVAAMLTAGLAANAPAQTLVFCSEGAPESFNPQLTTSGTTVDATSVTLYNRLVEFSVGTTTLEPSLAERWDISPDGKVYTFHLRKDVKFHTTKTFTPTRNFNADDVIFSFMRQKDPANPYHNVSGGVYANFDSMALGTLITAIDKLDDATVRFTLAHAEAPFLADLGMYFASILSKEYADQMLKAGTPERVDTQPVGTGPFQLVQYQKDSRILYKVFDHYWEGKPKLDRLVFTITPDAAVRYAKLEKNECQVMPFPNPADLPRMRNNPDLTLMQKPGLNIGFLAFNVKKPPLDNLKVRQALALAVNKPAIMEAVFNGTGQQAKNLLPPGVWSANTAVQDYPYDPAQAKKLLADAGLGQGFAIDLWAMPVQRPYNPNARRMAEMIQADWAKIDVKATIVTYEWGEYLQRVKRGEHQTALMGWTTANGDPDNFFGPLYSCASANGGSNSSQWCYPPFDKLITAARATLDQNQRTAMYQQAQVMMHEQVPALMIAHSTIFEPVRKEVVNYQIDPFGKHIFRYVSLKE
ncbi:ABC transporter substrate-binding protein [Chimaeribacter arupi]|uniref:ABC transporter substrate-binding protein n=1 Tax=Chimaeribacter arupi TaxID=2060066 RepID=UPI0027121366|nr:ABC transporter substrate-binding protein [Chimaeribacter arupi]WKZ93448.1 ABC transporter substrate-binding protein [Chimaeribacter arupi]